MAENADILIPSLDLTLCNLMLPNSTIQKSSQKLVDRGVCLYWEAKRLFDKDGASRRVLTTTLLHGTCCLEITINCAAARISIRLTRLKTRLCGSYFRRLGRLSYEI